jgi:hypothetical protein
MTRPDQRRIPLRLLVLGLLLLMATTIGGYGLSYMTTYAQDRTMPASQLCTLASTNLNGCSRLDNDNAP